VQGWLGREAIEQLALVCQERIDAVYRKIAQRCDAEDAVFFAEKFTASTAPSLMWELYPHAREVILVRDFRDMIASVIAFNEKKGGQMFGRTRVRSNEDFVRRMGGYGRTLVGEWHRRSDRAHLVRYEDMIQKPLETVRSLVDYLEVDASEDNLRAMAETVGYTPPDMAEHGTSAGIEASIGRWREDLSDELKRVCEDAFAVPLETFGYTTG
jgi:hypothetical protein